MAEARRLEAIAAARRLLEAEGPQALSMRRIADELAIRAPSLYKHVRDKDELEVALIAEALHEFGDALTAAGPSLRAVLGAYHRYAVEHPHLYALVTERPLPRDRLPAGLEERAARPLSARLADEHQARAVWAAAHGLATLELHGRFPPDADLDAAWAALATAFESSPANASPSAAWTGLTR